MARRRYLVMYDICDDARLRCVHDVVRSHGSRFQYSVFLCDLSASELIQLQWELGEVMDQSIDSVAIVDLGREDLVKESTFIYMGLRPPPSSRGATVL